ncbi:MAG: arginase family protein [Deltaproteobacteria bacterium]|nr:arginase family protein [Deltaproteobacteria bacterium]
MNISALDRLRLFLRPPGRGLHTNSTGGGYATPVLKKLYGTDSNKEVMAAWEESLQKLRRVEGVVFGIPSDIGAGILRGANLGPIGVRDAYLTKYSSFPKTLVDIGDVIVIPQLLHDEMLNDKQLAASRSELYPNRTVPLPVGPLSIAEALYEALMELNPELKIFMIGGDHSVSWPAMVHCHKRFGDSFGVLHFDAHSDLMESRLGIKYCFATWACHAARLIKPHQMVQVGIRTSTKTKQYWMEKFPLLQVWASEIPGRETEVISEILQYLVKSGVKRIYITNDIDGTDPKYAPATGTPEPNGLGPQFVLGLIAAIRQKFQLIGGDIVEVAPPLSGSRDFSQEKTCEVAADYLHALF